MLLLRIQTDRAEDAMNLELEFSYRAEVKMPVTVGPGPYGTRLFFEVVGGSFEGKRLKGKVLSGGGDWLLAGEDGFARIDVRVQFLTDDGAVGDRRSPLRVVEPMHVRFRGTDPARPHSRV